MASELHLTGKTHSDKRKVFAALLESPVIRIWLHNIPGYLMCSSLNQWLYLGGGVSRRRSTGHWKSCCVEFHGYDKRSDMFDEVSD